MKYSGGWIIAAGSLLGLAVSIYNYFSEVSFLAPDSRIAGTVGALVAVAATAVLFIAGVYLLRRRRNRGLTLFFAVGTFIGVLGTGFAAYLLNSTVLLALMAIVGVGWLIRVFGSSPAYARA